MWSGKGHLLRVGVIIIARHYKYRVLYDFDGTNIEILLFVSMKQDFGKLLYRYNILK